MSVQLPSLLLGLKQRDFVLCVVAAVGKVVRGVAAPMPLSLKPDIVAPLNAVAVTVHAVHKEED